MDVTRNRVLRVFIVLCILCPFSLCGLGYYFYNSWFGGPAHDLPQERRLARQEGLPLTPADLKPKPVAEAANAATVYRPFFDRIERYLRKHSTLSANCKRILDGRPVSPEDEKTIRTALNDLRESLNQIAAASKRTVCDFGHDFGPDRRLPELAQGRDAALLLCVRAHYRGQNRETKEAFADIAAAERLGRHLGQAPLVIGLLMRINCDRYAFDAFQQLTNLTGGEPGDLALAKRTLKGFGPVPDLRFVFGGGVVASQVGLDSVSRSSDSQAEIPAVLPDAMRSKALHRWRQVYAELPKSSEDWQGALRVLNKHAEEVDNDPSFSNLLSSVFFPSTIVAPKAIGRRQARMRLAEVALALWDVKAKTGTFPEFLPDCGEAGIDPFDGKPMRYRRLGDGFLLYSIDRDGRDDGGQHDPKRETGDLTWEYRPEEKR